MCSNRSSTRRARQKYVEASAKADALRAENARKNRLFLDAQAGMLAATLAEGRPCPVCGSTEHPSPAKPAEDAPTEAELESAKLAAERAGEEERYASAAAAQLSGTLEAKSAELTALCSRLLGELPENPAQSAKSALLECKSEIKRQHEAQVMAERKIERRAELDKLITGCERERQALAVKISEIEKAIASADGELAAVEKSAAELAGKLEFAGRAEAEGD